MYGTMQFSQFSAQCSFRLHEYNMVRSSLCPSRLTTFFPVNVLTCLKILPEFRFWFLVFQEEVKYIHTTYTIKPLHLHVCRDAQKIEIFAWWKCLMSSVKEIKNYISFDPGFSKLTTEFNEYVYRHRTLPFLSLCQPPFDTNSQKQLVPGM